MTHTEHQPPLDLEIRILAVAAVEHTGKGTFLVRFRRAVNQIAAALPDDFLVRLFQKPRHRLVALEYFPAVLVDYTDAVGNCVEGVLPLTVEIFELSFLSCVFREIFSRFV